MKFLLILILIAVWTMSGNGQTFIKGITVNDGPNQCDIVATVEGMNIPPTSIIMVWDDANFEVDTLINIQDTINGVCADGIYTSSVVLDRDKHFALILDSLDTLSMYCRTPILPVGFNWTLDSYLAPSSPVAQDGEIIITFSEQVVEGGAAPGMFTDWGLNNYAYSTPDSLTYTVTGISEGLFSVNFMTVGVTNIYQFDGYLGEFINSSVNNNLSVDINIVDAISGCNGMAAIVPDSAVGPVSYLWSDSNFNGLSSLSGLCPAVYRCLVEDSVGNNSLIEFLVTDISSNYVIAWNGPLSPMDTINYAFSNCNIDYSVPIDSVEYSEHLYNTVADTNFFEFTITLYQDTSVLTTVDSFYVTTDTLVYMAFGFYCETIKSTFKGFKYFVPRDGTQLDVTELTALKPERIFIYPNPANEIITLNVDKKTKFTIIDVQGKQILGGILYSGENLIDISKLESGSYFLSLNEFKDSFRIIKK